MFPIIWSALLPVRLVAFVVNERILTRADGQPRFARKDQ